MSIKEDWWDDNSDYYPARLDELHLGFEMEVLYPSGEYVKGTFYSLIGNHPELNKYDDIYMKAIHAVMRVKRLDREDIESCGWQYFKTEYNRNISEFEKDNYMLAILPDKRLSIILKDITKDEEASRCSNGQIYLGYCHSINEFRSITKLLGI